MGVKNRFFRIPRIYADAFGWYFPVADLRIAGSRIRCVYRLLE